MKVLLLHPDDVPWRGKWAACHWDLVVDLSFAGANVYEEWSKRTGARVISLRQFAGQTESHRWVNEILEHARGQFLDRLGLDWWEILAPCGYQELQALYLLRQLQQELGPGSVEIFATRAHPHVRLLSVITGFQISCFIAVSSPARRFASRIYAAAQTLRPSQSLEIAFDKWDPSYRFRSRIAKHRRVHLSAPVVLLPSAYSNVTRAQLAYATQLPDRRFLLATTRHSGESEDLPSNVDSVPIAAYAEDSSQTGAEIAEFVKSWNLLKARLSEVRELRQGLGPGLWDYFPEHLKSGLRIRDAWQILMSSEPVAAVLCGDDLNYYTRLPLILAKHMGRVAIYFSHGALDGGLLFKKSYADRHLVKGEMERDYMLRVSDIELDKIEIAAPIETGHEDVRTTFTASRSGDIVFFSQPYEVSGGRAKEIYGELLPRIAAVAQQINRKVILKLHPFESKRGRERLLRTILRDRDYARFEISRTAAASVIPHALCGVGLDSSVAVECAQRGIPYFLCGWLDFSGFGYMQQFAKFGVGIVLDSPDQILTIPQRLKEFRPDPSKIKKLWQPADSDRLDEIMFGNNRVFTADKCAS